MESKQQQSSKEKSDSVRKASSDDQTKRAQKISPWEWAIALVSAVLVLGTIGLMLYEALDAPSTPPDIAITVEEIIRTDSSYVVVFSAHNRGQTTAASLSVEGELTSGGQTVEKSAATLDYVPSEAKRQGGLFFSSDPQQYNLTIRPKGYDQP